MKKPFYGIEITDKQVKTLSLGDKVKVTITGSILELRSARDIADSTDGKESEGKPANTIEIESSEVEVEAVSDNEFSDLADSEDK